MAGQKKYEPSSRKLKKAREDGDVAKSRYLSGAGSLIGCLCFFIITGIHVDGILQILYKITQVNTGFSLDSVIVLGSDIAWVFFMLVVAPLGVSTVFGLVFELVQVGWHPKFSLLAPKCSRLDPVQGFKRMFGAASAEESLMAGLFFEVAKLTAIVIGGTVVSALVSLLIGRELVSAQAFDRMLILGLAEDALLLSALLMGALVFGCGVVDYAMQYQKRRKRLRMDAEELKKENRESEGDPEQRGMRKQLHLEVLAQNVAQRIRKAAVVVLGRKNVS